MKNIAEFLEREGGHVFALIVLVLVFALLARFCAGDSPFFKEVALVGFGAVLGGLMMAMKGAGTKSTQNPDAKETPAKPDVKPAAY